MEKTKKNTILIRIANIVTVIICLFVLVIAIAAITNSINGYNNVFGSTVLAVETNSMDGDREDSFEKGDLIVCNVLRDKKKTELKEGDVITFWTFIEGQRVLNTHRIVDIEEGNQIAYVTKGDANLDPDAQRVVPNEVVARYSYKLKGMGNVLLFLQSSTGFLIFIVIPSILALAYCVFLFVRSLKGFNKLKKEEEKEKYKQELLGEMNGKEEKDTKVNKTNNTKEEKSAKAKVNKNTNNAKEEKNKD